MSGSITERLTKDPLWQAMAVAAVLVIMQVFVFFMTPLLQDLITPESPWVVTIAMLLLFMLFNAVSTFTAKDLVWHWSRSIYGLVGVGALGYLLSWMISGLTLKDMDGFVDLFLIVVIGFMTLKTIATTISALIAFIKRKDEQHLNHHEM